MLAAIGSAKFAAGAKASKNILEAIDNIQAAMEMTKDIKDALERNGIINVDGDADIPEKMPVKGAIAKRPEIKAYIIRHTVEYPNNQPNTRSFGSKTDTFPACSVPSKLKDPDTTGTIYKDQKE